MEQVLPYLRARRMAAVYGLMLTGWSAGGIAGPQLTAFLQDHCGPAASTCTFLSAMGFVTAGVLLSLALPRTDGGRPAR